MKNITYIDLFSGLGGFRIALDSLDFQCVYSADNDKHAVEIYKENFGDDSYNDITKISPEDIPDFDILCGGFPCQPYSASGQKKGFEDTRGTLFFDICRIIDKKHPKIVFLENVKNLEQHDKGNTLKVIKKSLNDLGYHVDYKVLNARDFGVPQNRERIIIIANNLGKTFDFDKINKQTITSMKRFLDTTGDFEYLHKDEYTLIDNPKRQPSDLLFVGYRNKNIRKNGVKENTENLSRAHKQPNRIYSADGVHPTLSSTESSGRYFILIDGKVRKLTIDECFRFMGFPKDYKKIGKKTQLYKRIGNSICVPMVKEIGKQIEKQLL